MEAGMGIMEGHATSDAAAPAFGRTINVGAEAERPVTNMALGGQMSAIQPGRAGQQRLFPGFPQDMFMVMDDLVAKPETYGLRPGWTGGTMGMMTIVRVLKPDLFDKIMALKAEQAGKAAQ